MSRTKKPCPGCGEVHSYRAANEVCAECKKLITEARENRERIAAKVKGTEFRLLSDRPFDLPYIPHQKFEKPQSDAVQEQILKLVNLLGEKAPGESSHTVPPLVQTPPNSRGESTFHWDVWQLPKGFGEIINKLYHGILGVAEVAYLEGVEHGEHFVNRLARGELSASDVSEHDERLAQAKQKKKKRP